MQLLVVFAYLSFREHTNLVTNLCCLQIKMLHLDSLTTWVQTCFYLLYSLEQTWCYGQLEHFIGSTVLMIVFELHIGAQLRRHLYAI